jgi:hypothetical protein
MSLLISYRTVSDCPAIKHTVDSTGFVKPAGRGWKTKRQNTYIINAAVSRSTSETRYNVAVDLVVAGAGDDGSEDPLAVGIGTVTF